MYTLEIKKEAYRSLAKLPKNYYVAIRDAIDNLANEPHPHGSIKLKGYNDLFRIRIGMYRVIYSVENDVLVIQVIAIGHRKDIYK